jgi:hypothetical protein
VPVVGITDAVQITVGTNHACARRANDAIWCWGDDTYGILGDGSGFPALQPVRVAEP